MNIESFVKNLIAKNMEMNKYRSNKIFGVNDCIMSTLYPVIVNKIRYL